MCPHSRPNPNPMQKGNKKLPPTERLPVYGETFEEQVACFAYKVFQPLGLNVDVISRTPYLCQGDMYNPYYVLNDAIFVLSSTRGDHDSGSQARTEEGEEEMGEDSSLLAENNDVFDERV